MSVRFLLAIFLLLVSVALPQEEQVALPQEEQVALPQEEHEEFETLNTAGFSDIETSFAIKAQGRLKTPLRQFGYELFKKSSMPLGSREFTVYVTGYVKNPGAVIVTELNTVLDAITLAGGVRKNGSLRSIILKRKDKDGHVKEINVDLYNLLIRGDPINIQLQEGDIILVGSIGRVVGIAGSVKRPGIYELKHEQSLKDILNLAGDLQPSAYEYSVEITRYEGNKLKLIEGSLKDNVFLDLNIKDGDLIYVKRIAPVIANIVNIEGHVMYPGNYSIEVTPTLRHLLKKAGMYVDTNLYYGELIRKRKGRHPIYLTFVPKDILEGKSNIKLRAFDTVKLYKVGVVKGIDFNKFKNAFIIKGHIKYPGVFALKKGMKLSDVLTEDMLLLDTNLYYAEIIRKNLPDLDYKVINFAPKDILSGKRDIRIQKTDVIVFYPKWIYAPIKVSGEVEEPKLIPYYKGIKLLDVLMETKLKDSPYWLKAEIYREMKEEDMEKQREAKDIEEKVEGEEKVYKEKFVSVYLYDLLIKGDESKNIELMPGDSILVRRIVKGEKLKKITILGEVAHPGVYEYREGMTLYDIIKKAGGFTRNAYPKGLILIRESAKKLQEQQLNATLLSLEEYILKTEENIGSLESTEDIGLVKFTLEKHKRMLEIMKQRASLGLGRIALDVPEDLDKLKNSPENITLEDGDYIYIPSRPRYVLILGEVYNQISLPYISGKTVEYYINLVGGLKESAKEEEIYIIKANGRVISNRQLTDKMSMSWTNRKLYITKNIMDIIVEEGDTIVIPSEIKIPVMWRPLIRDVVQIIFQAISTAVLAKRL